MFSFDDDGNTLHIRRYSSHSEQPAGGFRRPIMSSYVLEVDSNMTLLLLEYHAKPFMDQAQVKLLDLAAYIQPNLHMDFVPGDEEKALHFRTQGKDVLGNA